MGGLERISTGKRGQPKTLKRIDLKVGFLVKDKKREVSFEPVFPRPRQPFLGTVCKVFFIYGFF